MIYLYQVKGKQYEPHKQVNHESEVVTMTNTVKLQGICNHKMGIKVSDLRPGNILLWNYGYKSEVINLIPSKTGKTITLQLKSLQDGIIRNRKMSSETLVVQA